MQERISLQDSIEFQKQEMKERAAAHRQSIRNLLKAADKFESEGKFAAAKSSKIKADGLRAMYFPITKLEEV